MSKKQTRDDSVRVIVGLKFKTDETHMDVDLEFVNQVVEEMCRHAGLLHEDLGLEVERDFTSLPDEVR